MEAQVAFLGCALPGQDKWLGAAVGCDGAIYGIPGSHRSVLRIALDTGEVTTIGQLRGPAGRGSTACSCVVESSLPANQFKWLRGIAVQGGTTIYGIPSNADSVLKITPETQEVTTVGGPFRGQWKWHGGVLARDGNIYCIPCNAEAVLKIVPRTGEITTIGGPLPGEQKWYGGALGHDGAVYGIPYNATGVLKIVPETGEVTVMGSVPAGGWKWHGCVTCSDGTIIGIPSHADTVLKIVPDTGEVSMIGGPLENGHFARKGYKYGGGVLGGDGCVYALPSDADRVLKIVPHTGEVVSIGRSFHCQNKWQNGFLASDGAIYGIPCNYEAVLKIVPSTGEITTLGGPWPGKEKWEGGIVAPDGALYCMPQQARFVLRIAEAGAAWPWPNRPRSGTPEEHMMHLARLKDGAMPGATSTMGSSAWRASVAALLRGIGAVLARRCCGSADALERTKTSFSNILILEIHT